MSSIFQFCLGRPQIALSREEELKGLTELFTIPEPRIWRWTNFMLFKKVDWRILKSNFRPGKGGARAMSSTYKLQINPTDSFSIWELENQEIGKLYVVQERRATYFEAPKLWNCRSGITNDPIGIKFRISFSLSLFTSDARLCANSVPTIFFHNFNASIYANQSFGTSWYLLISGFCSFGTSGL